MDGVVAVFGVPKRIHSDQGKNFVGKVATLFYQRLGIQQSNTTAYHPQGNGYCERSHRFLMDTLAKLSREQQRQWPRYLSGAVLAFNASTSAVTGFSPYESVFGRPPSLPSDLAYSQVHSAGTADKQVPPDTLQYLSRLQKTLTRTDQLVLEASMATHNRSKLRHDARIVEHTYTVGDRVWLRRHAVTRYGPTRSLGFPVRTRASTRHREIYPKSKTSLRSTRLRRKSEIRREVPNRTESPPSDALLVVTVAPVLDPPILAKHLNVPRF